MANSDNVSLHQHTFFIHFSKSSKLGIESEKKFKLQDALYKQKEHAMLGYNACSVCTRADLSLLLS